MWYLSWFVLGCLLMSRSPSVFHTSSGMDFTTSLYGGLLPPVLEHSNIHSTACVKNRGASAHENTSQNKTKIGTTLITASRRFVSNERPKNLQTAENSRGWLEIGRFSNQIDCVDANYFSKTFRTNERANNKNQKKETNKKVWKKN